VGWIAYENDPSQIVIYPIYHNANKISIGKNVRVSIRMGARW